MTELIQNYLNQYDLSQDIAIFQKCILPLEISIILSIILSVCYIAYKDVTGQWEKYRIRFPAEIEDPWKETPLKKYYAHINYIVRDVMIVLPLFAYLFVKFVPNQFEALTIPFSEINILKEIIYLIIGYSLSKAYGTIIHFFIHLPGIYQKIHKMHHTPLYELSSTSGWKQTIYEFILMDIPASFFLGPIFFPISIYTMCIWWAYIGIGTSTDHTTFFVNYWIDCRHHILHHMNVAANYSELEIIDVLIGTKREI